MRVPTNKFSGLIWTRQRDSVRECTHTLRLQDGSPSFSAYKTLQSRTLPFIYQANLTKASH